jgi:transglutaminase-like putative cysteine protease
MYMLDRIMNVKIAPSRIAILFISLGFGVPATGKMSDDVITALKHAGENRTKLGTALRALNGKDIDYLIGHASQYDLVNLTVDQIVENVTYARKVHQAFPYLGEKLDEELWLEWVLPYRVMDEDLGRWRKTFHDKLSPLLVNATTTKEAAEAVLKWVWSDHSNDSRIELKLKSAESRKRNSSQLMASKDSACSEFNLFYVAALRSVGIPARHCMASRWYHRDSYHFYTEYWDSQLKRWVAVDSTDDEKLNAATVATKITGGRWHALAYYAHPGWVPESDVYGKSLWEACVPVTENITSLLPVSILFPGLVNGATVSVYVWSSGTWRGVQISKAIANGDEGASCTVELGKCASMERPVLFTATDGESLKWAISTISGESQTVHLKDVGDGDGLSWSPVMPAGVAVKNESEQEGVNRE